MAHDDSWLAEALALGLQRPMLGARAAAPDEVCISLVAYESSEWIDALLANARQHTTACLALHLNRKSNYSVHDLARWNNAFVAVNPERVVVDKGYGSILYAHLLNARLLAQRWPSRCRLMVLLSAPRRAGPHAQGPSIRRRCLLLFALVSPGRVCARHQSPPLDWRAERRQ